MGKWKKLRGDLENLPPRGNKEYLQKLDQVRQDTATLSLEELCQEFRVAKERKKHYLNQLGHVNIEIEGLSRVIVEVMEAKQLQNLTFEGAGGTFFLRVVPYPSIEDKEALMRWVKDEGNEYLLGILFPTLSAVVKDNLEKGVDTPPGVKVYLKTSVGFRK